MLPWLSEVEGGDLLLLPGHEGQTVLAALRLLYSCLDVAPLRLATSPPTMTLFSPCFVNFLTFKQWPLVSVLEMITTGVGRICNDFIRICIRLFHVRNADPVDLQSVIVLCLKC